MHLRTSPYITLYLYHGHPCPSFWLGPELSLVDSKAVPPPGGANEGGGLVEGAPTSDCTTHPNIQGHALCAAVAGVVAPCRPGPVGPGLCDLSTSLSLEVAGWHLGGWQLGGLGGNNMFNWVVDALPSGPVHDQADAPARHPSRAQSK